MSAITIADLAKFRLGRDAVSGSDFGEASLPIMGGCEVCYASIAAYNAYPSLSGFIRCAAHIGDDGWESAEEADAAIFDEVRQ